MRPLPFVVLEGLDGTGKTTLADMLAERLRSRGTPAVAIHTPTEPYSEIAQCVIDHCSPLARFHFFVAAVVSASNHIRSLLENSAVICDRYIYTTLAYHRAAGVITDLSPEDLGIVTPDLRLLLTVQNLEVRRTRIGTRGNVTSADQNTCDNSALVARIDEEYRRFNLVHVDTSYATPAAIVAQLERMLY